MSSIILFSASAENTQKIEYFNLQALKKAYVKNNSSLDSKTLNRTKSINNKSVKESKNTSFEMDYTKDDKMKWDDFPSLNVARNYASFFVYNNNYLYVFFGYNHTYETDNSKFNHKKCKFQHTFSVAS